MGRVERTDVVQARDVCGRIADFLSANPNAWTQYMLAREVDGNPTTSLDPAARSWCALGLLEKFAAGRRELIPECLKLLSRAIAPPGTPFVPIHRYNDANSRSVGDMVRVFRCASLMPSISTMDFCEPQDLYYTITGDIAAGAALEIFAKLKQAAPPPVFTMPPPDWKQIALQSPWSKFAEEARAAA